MEKLRVFGHGATIAAHSVHQNNNSPARLALEKIAAQGRAGSAREIHFRAGEICRQCDSPVRWRDQ